MTKILTLTGLSCTGKTTIAKELVEKYPHVFFAVVAFTTRNKRPEEKNTKDYYFISEVDFQNYLASGEVAEFSQIGKHFYGIFVDEIAQITDSNKIGIAVTDTTGVKKLKESYNVISILIHPESEELLRERVRKYRGEAFYANRFIDEEKLFAEKLRQENIFDFDITHRFGELSKTMDSIYDFVSSMGYISNQ